MNDKRERYKSAKAREDRAWEAMQAATATLRPEYEAAGEAIETLLDDGDLVGTCMNCSEPVFEGEAHQQCGEGEINCSECAAFLSEIIKSWRFEVEQDAEEGWRWNEHFDSKDAYLEHLASMEVDLIENGDRKVLAT